MRRKLKWEKRKQFLSSKKVDVPLPFIFVASARKRNGEMLLEFWGMLWNWVEAWCLSVSPSRIRTDDMRCLALYQPGFVSLIASKRSFWVTCRKKSIWSHFILNYRLRLWVYATKHENPTPSSRLNEGLRQGWPLQFVIRICWRSSWSSRFRPWLSFKPCQFLCRPLLHSTDTHLK